MSDSPELYVKEVSKGGKVSYKKFEGPVARYASPEAPLMSEFDDKELITAGVSLGMMMLMLLENTLPPHSRNARKIKAVTDAIVDLAKGQGSVLEQEMVDYWVNMWNYCMEQMQLGLVEKYHAVKTLNGKYVYDPRDNLYHESNNPALILGDLIFSKKIITDVEIGEKFWNQIADMANMCEELVDEKEA